MVHNAYDSLQLIKDCPSTVECVGLWDSKLLISCIDCSLRIYAPPPESSQPSISNDPPSSRAGVAGTPYALERSISGFSRKGLISMEVIKNGKVLVWLSSEGLGFHRLPGFEAGGILAKGKGVNVYSWDERRGMLCMGRQKKVVIYRFEGGRDFIELKEFNVLDMVKSMGWCGENICLGIRREYMILNTTNSLLTEVFTSGRIAPPSVVPLPSGGLLLGRDNIGFLFDQNGKVLPEGRICWSDAPGSVAIHMQYAVARLPRHIEIRSLRAPYPLVQTIALRDARGLLSSKHCVIATLQNSVYGLLPVPLGAQIVQLTASSNFEEALALCELLPPEDSTLRAAKEGSIRIRYGHHLFDNGSYEEAMEQFLKSPVDITYVLSLYPLIDIPKSQSVTESEKTLESASDAYLLSRASSDASDEMEGSSPSSANSQPLESDEKATLEYRKTSHNSLMALIKYLQKKRDSIIERATAEVTEEVVAYAVQETSTSPDSHWSRSSGKNRGHVHKSSGAREMVAILDTALLQALIHTGQGSSALALMKSPNYCDIKICEEFLLQRKFYSGLLELYQRNEMHREALKLLNQLIQESGSDENLPNLGRKYTPEMIIDYLKTPSLIDPMLTLEYAAPVLESCPEQTIELFLSGNLPPELVTSYLKRHAPHMQVTYLEHMLTLKENGIPAKLQNELVQLYLSEGLESYNDLVAQQNWDENVYSPTRRKLLSFLESTSAYDPELLLKRLPTDALYEERALLLGKMQQHQLALILYVHKLHEPELALAYCDRVFYEQASTNLKASPNIYLTLLQIYLNPKRTTKEFEKKIVSLVTSQSFVSQKVGGVGRGKGGRGSKKIVEIEGAHDQRQSTSSTDSGRSDIEGDEVSEEGITSIMLDEALDLLGKRWNRINGAQALKLLPSQTKLQNLLPFLEPLLKKSSEGRRNFAVINSLRQSENLQVKEDLYKERKRMVKISSESICSLCNKRIGSSVFAVYPNGTTLVHFICFRDAQSIKAVSGAPVKRI